MRINQHTHTHTCMHVNTHTHRDIHAHTCIFICMVVHNMPTHSVHVFKPMLLLKVMSSAGLKPYSQPDDYMRLKR